MAAYFFASPVDVEVKLEGEDDRKKVDMKTEKEKMITCPVYYDGDPVSGQVCYTWPCLAWRLTSCAHYPGHSSRPGW